MNLGSGEVVEVSCRCVQLYFTCVVCQLKHCFSWHSDVSAEDQERLAKEDLLRELAAKMGLPASIVPATTTTRTTTTTEESTTANAHDVFIMGHSFNQTRHVKHMFKKTFFSFWNKTTRMMGLRAPVHICIGWFQCNNVYSVIVDVE